ncbi:MAG: septal ring lytic transglycosylase RlpA family protein [Labilithrix sp.]|nr:septal ring lytic transglycosylase RlpA family protein [Labilithrix sp.]MCW5810759.1 septal ring lytic transglycosylase RlpA family protein [Labilithrix sp.]
MSRSSSVRLAAVLALALVPLVSACGDDPAATSDGVVDESGGETPAAADDAGASEPQAEDEEGSLPVGTTLRTTARLNFREGPSTDARIIRTLPIGTLVTVIESAPDNGFYRVRVDGEEGWVHGNYVQSSTAVPESEVPAEPEPKPTGRVETCKASYYASGSRTANGERFDPNGLTAAHKTLPFNTKVRVTNTATGASVDVRINDRGPYAGGRCIDLARGAFTRIAPTSQGVANVRVEVLQ